MSLRIVPITTEAAERFVDAVHRHHGRPPVTMFGVAAAEGSVVVAVALVNQPSARALSDGWTVEVTRLASMGARNACSMLYRAAWRSANARGYRRIVTYTRDDELGASLRAAGWVKVGHTKGRSWDTPSRRRTDKTEIIDRDRWEIVAADYDPSEPCPQPALPDTGQLALEWYTPRKPAAIS